MWDSDLGGTVCGALEPAHIAAFVRRASDSESARVLIDLHPLNGGLESRGVARVHAESSAHESAPRRLTFVVKRLDGSGQRELAAYEFLSAIGARGIPSLLGVRVIGPRTSYLFLEWIAALHWPWAEPKAVAQVLDRLADLHSCVSDVMWPSALSEWDYEAELLRAAADTLDALESAVQTEMFAGLRQLIEPLRRVVTSLPRMRRVLSASLPARTVLHGDVHSGNVLMRNGDLQPILLDWGRVRLGSPLEDVSSLLESLAYWEPAVRLHRASLLQHYMRARRLHELPRGELDLCYWLAAASNTLAGALRYHLERGLRAGNAPEPKSGDSAIRAARDHLRSIEQADALWREFVIPEVIVIIKGAQATSSIEPVDHGQAGVSGPEGFPTGSSHTLEHPENLTDDAGMRDDQYALAGMLSGNAVHGAQDPISEIAVAFTAGPAETIVGLPQIGPPVDGITFLDLGERQSIEATAVDLAQ